MTNIAAKLIVFGVEGITNQVDQGTVGAAAFFLFEASNMQAFDLGDTLRFRPTLRKVSR
jgi:hypothetical protein